MGSRHQAGHPAHTRRLALGNGASLFNVHQAAVDRELAELERRKLLELRGGSVKLTREGYLELARRFPRRRS